MKDIHEELEYMCEIITKEISSANDKLAKSGGGLSGDDISYIDKLTHALKSIKSVMAMDESGYSGRMMYEEEPYSRNSYARRRDSMGRYSRYDEREYPMR